MWFGEYFLTVEMWSFRKDGFSLTVDPSTDRPLTIVMFALVTTTQWQDNFQCIHFNISTLTL